MEQDWITKSEVTTCEKYRKISTHYNGFKVWLEEGHLVSKEGPGINGKPSTFFNVKELNDLMKKIEEVEEHYLTDKETILQLGFKEKNFTTKKLLKKITEIIALCDAEKIEYKYYENGFNKSFLYVNKVQLLHFLETHIS
ncbi:hypothetical protein OCF53_21635, partial [Bacillus pacificus]|nr:hypothetical protein [Bacillus pacificus]